MGHHGRPVSIDRQRDVLSAIFEPAGRSAAEQFAVAVSQLLASGPLAATHLRDRDVLRATWWVTGLITTADWIGSNELEFPYTAPIARDASLLAYWQLAEERAVSAVRNAGLEPPSPAKHRTFAELTGRADLPTPAQRWASNVALPDGPTLFILEDVTGAGKTEAAQILIHRLMAAGRASGAFWAMPTQATANAMYDRQAKSLLKLFEDNVTQIPSLVLAHGQSRMHKGFRATVIAEPGDKRDSIHADDADVPGEIACAAFLANSSRAAMIADVGAGTVDQAILAVLPSKFNTMRLFGLAEKVLVLDEIHAYDAYMVQELKALLRFHAALGGSVIALSATLSSKLTSDLIREWQGAMRPSNIIAGDLSPCTKYPLATVVGGDGTVIQEPLDATPWSRRTVPVTLIHHEEEVIQALVSAASDGAAAVWIRNTVDSCRAAAATLRQRGAQDVTVFHARFAQFDRQRRETDVLARFGPTDSPRRAGSILVATQVVEQSLDLDFDVMATDLAPIDLLIQRLGRLWRNPHRSMRPPKSHPQLLVVAPPFNANPPSSWLDELLPKTKWVYHDAGVLWRTLRTLDERHEIVTPDGIRDLVAQVYDDDFCPPTLQASADRARGEQSAATGTAMQYVLNIQSGYVGEGLLWASDVRVPTRLSDFQTTVRLGRVMPDGSVAPWADTPYTLPPWHRWALSEVRVSRHRLPTTSRPDPALRAACNAVRTTWGRWEQEIPLVPLQPYGNRWRGSAVRPDGQIIAIEYDADFGFSFSPAPDNLG